MCDVTVCLVVGLMELCSAASSRHGKQRPAARRSSDYYQYQYTYEDSQSGGYSYSEVDDYEVPVEPRKCYWCSYAVFDSLNHVEGVKECMDPFTGDGVWETECHAPCAVGIYLSYTHTHTHTQPFNGL